MKFAVLERFNGTKEKELEIRIAALESQIANATLFVREIEKGNLDAVDELLTDGARKAALGASLLSLRDQLKQYSIEEKQRNWVTEGLAKFIEILRSKNNDLGELTDDIISNLVNYMGANQGALYIINDREAKKPYLEMVACYAYNRKKYLHQRIEVGEGLVGQVVLEKESIYMTEIPDGYLRITSGLGQALPKNLLIVPLKIEETILGVIELASFHVIKKYQIEFVERLGESIASTISNVKINQQTQLLLQETQSQTEQMRSQEEEVRQNMEELSATQEEMQRVLKTAQDKELYLNELINVPKDSIFTVDQNYRVLSYNKAFASSLEAMGLRDLKGLDLMTLFPDEKQKKEQIALYNRAFKGENFEITNEYPMPDGSMAYYSSNYAPLRDAYGEIIAVASFAKDVTSLVSAQKKAEQLLQDSKQASEELRAQEEELRQNMEELSASQEEMHRIIKDAQAKERYYNELINVPKDSIFTVDKQYRILTYNKAFSSGLEAMGIANLKGFDMLDLFQTEQEKEKQREILARAFKGENFEIVAEYEGQGNVSYYASNYAPLHDGDGTINAVACFSKDVTELVKAQQQHKK